MYVGKLKNYRRRIDAIDRKIARLLSSRFNLVEKIKSYKKINKVRITDKKRELDVLSNVKKYSKNRYKKSINQIFRTIINYSKKIQK